MPDDQTRRKLQLLAGRVQGRITTFGEDRKLDEAIDAKLVRTRQDVREVIGEALEKNASDVGVALANHDDSDRLIDDIVSQLKK